MERTDYVVYFDGLIIPQDEVIAVNPSSQEQALKAEYNKTKKGEHGSRSSVYEEEHLLSGDFTTWCDHPFLEDSNVHRVISYNRSINSSSYSKPMRCNEPGVSYITQKGKQLVAAVGTAQQEENRSKTEREEYSCKIDPTVFVLTDIDYIRIKCKWQFQNVTDFETNPRVIEHMRYLDLFTQCFSLRLLQDIPLDNDTDKTTCYTFQNNDDCTKGVSSFPTFNPSSTTKCIPEKEWHKGERQIPYFKNDYGRCNAPNMYGRVDTNCQQLNSKVKDDPLNKEREKHINQEQFLNNEVSSVASSVYSNITNDNSYPYYKEVNANKNSYTKYFRKQRLNVHLENNNGNNSVGLKMESLQTKQKCNYDKIKSEQSHRINTYDFIKEENISLKDTDTITNCNNYPYYKGANPNISYTKSLSKKLSMKVKLENDNDSMNNSFVSNNISSNYEKTKTEQNHHIGIYNFVKKKNVPLEDTETISLTSVKQLKDVDNDKCTAQSSEQIYYIHKSRYICTSQSGPITMSTDKNNGKTPKKCSRSENCIFPETSKKMKPLTLETQRSRKSETNNVYKSRDMNRNNSTCILDHLMKNETFRNTYTKFTNSEVIESSSESPSTSSFILDTILHKQTKTNDNMEEQPIIIISLKQTDAKRMQEYTLSSEESKADARIRRYIQGDNLCKPGRYAVTSSKDKRKFTFANNRRRTLRYAKENRTVRPQVAWNSNIPTPCTPITTKGHNVHSTTFEQHFSTFDNSRKLLSSSYHETKHRKSRKGNNMCRNCGTHGTALESLKPDSATNSPQNLYVSCWRRFCVIL